MTEVPILPFRHDRDPRIVKDPFAGWMSLLEGHDAIGSDQGDAPVWVMLRYADMCRVMRETKIFSRRSTDAYSNVSTTTLIPIHLDAPEHAKYRRLINPLLSPSVAHDLDPVIRAHAISLIEELAPGGHTEFMRDFGFRFAPIIFMGLMGLPADDAPRFFELVDTILHQSAKTDDPGSDRALAYGELHDVFASVIDARRADPQDDFISTLVVAEVDGRVLTDDELQSMCLLLLLAGLDTVAATLGYAMAHFAQNPGDRLDVVEHPELIPNAVEEILRFFPIDTSIRYVAEDVEFAGCPMHADDRVVLPFVTANRDPAQFAHPDRFDIRRTDNRHVGFGVGPHRCAGSHLARVELAIALEEWHKRIPNYRIQEGAELNNLVSTTVFRLDSLPLVWN